MLLNKELKKEYGAEEYNSLPENYHEEHQDQQVIYWNEFLYMLQKENKKAVAERIRFLSNVGYDCLDLSYMDVKIDGKSYTILGTPFFQIPKKGYKKHLYNILKEEGIFIKDFFNCISILY